MQKKIMTEEVIDRKLQLLGELVEAVVEQLVKAPGWRQFYNMIGNVTVGKEPLEELLDLASHPHNDAPEIRLTLSVTTELMQNVGTRDYFIVRSRQPEMTDLDLFGKLYAAELMDSYHRQMKPSLRRGLLRQAAKLEQELSHG